MHTFVGATFVALFCIILGRPICHFALRVWTRWRDAPFKRYFPVADHIPLLTAVTGAFIGTYSHILLDSIMHNDMHPFRPFTSQNPFYLLIGPVTLHEGCIILGVLGTLYLAVCPPKKI